MIEFTREEAVKLMSDYEKIYQYLIKKKLDDKREILLVMNDTIELLATKILMKK